MNAATYIVLGVVGMALASALGAPFRVGSAHEIRLPDKTVVLVKFPGGPDVQYSSAALVKALKDAAAMIEGIEK